MHKDEQGTLLRVDVPLAVAIAEGLGAVQALVAALECNSFNVGESR
jgi:hypothetical protein